MSDFHCDECSAPHLAPWQKDHTAWCSQIGVKA